MLFQVCRDRKSELRTPTILFVHHGDPRGLSSHPKKPKAVSAAGRAWHLLHSPEGCVGLTPQEGQELDLKR